MANFNDTTVEKEIRYNRETKDYDCYVAGNFIGSASTYTAGEEICNTVAYDLIADGLCYTATELDGGAVEDTDGIIDFMAKVAAAIEIEQAEQAAQWAHARDTVRQHPAVRSLRQMDDTGTCTSYALSMESEVELDVQNGMEPSISMLGEDFSLSHVASMLPDLIALMNHPAVKALLGNIQALDMAA